MMMGQTLEALLPLLLRYSETPTSAYRVEIETPYNRYTHVICTPLKNRHFRLEFYDGHHSPHVAWTVFEVLPGYDTRPEKWCATRRIKSPWELEIRFEKVGRKKAVVRREGVEEVEIIPEDLKGTVRFR